MGTLVRVLASLLALAPAAGVLAVQAHVPSSALVVPEVQIATATGLIRLPPEKLGVRRTEEGLEVRDTRRLDRTIDELAATFARPAQAAGYQLTPQGVLLNGGAPGVELDEARTKALLIEALRGHLEDVTLPLQAVAPPPPPKYAIVVRLPEFRLDLYEGTVLVRHFPVGVGALRFPTPPGAYYVREKAKNPTWRNPGSPWARSMPRFIPPGARNPLGTRALRLDRGALVIHGTPQPSSVGRRSSHGCIRMRRADVEALFEIVPQGTPVFIVP